MQKRYPIYILLLIIALFFGCFAQEESGILVPIKNLPEGFKLLGIIDAETKGANITEEIQDFYGEEDIGLVNATVGKYQWGEMGVDYDAKITILQAQDEAHAIAAVSNYKSLDEWKMPPMVGVDRFSKAVVNGHEVLEIKDRVGQGLRYLYLWNKENVVVLVEGNGERSKSLELASCTGL
jgi:hypothetical protein